jgi:metal-responsive CopG/Arc/MetJ family transcriptional regulator
VKKESVAAMKAKKSEGKKKMKAESAAVRATISFPSEIYETLESIAKQKKVSLAWVVREAAEQYLAEKWPLFAKKEEGGQ